ncbi:MAG: hypothetical protein JEY94_14415 [Melioribacteraceae bacterium]|nr:hypothetical protein [Melioribacteraceae bacterium]
MNKKASNITSILLIVSLLLSTVGFVVYDHHCACNGTESHSILEETCCSSSSEIAENISSCCGKLVEKELPNCCESDQGTSQKIINAEKVCNCYSTTDYHSFDEYFVLTKIPDEIKCFQITIIHYDLENIKITKNIDDRNRIVDSILPNNSGKSFLIKTHQLKIPTIS